MNNFFPRTDFGLVHHRSDQRLHLEHKAATFVFVASTEKVREEKIEKQKTRKRKARIERAVQSSRVGDFPRSSVLVFSSPVPSLSVDDMAKSLVEKVIQSSRASNICRI